MKVLVVGKPYYNVIMPVESFLQEGSKINLAEKYELVGGTSVYTAILLAKWGMDVTYTGTVGGDIYGQKIKADLDGYKVNTKYIEINYEKNTAMNYLLINKQNGSSTQIIKDNDCNLLKYKYDFDPDAIIIDGTDLAGSTAAINNFPYAKTFLHATKVNNDYYNLSKRCKYVVANMKFAEALTKTKINIGRSKDLVNFFQKIKDLNKADYVVTLKDNGVLYNAERQVKILPAVKVNIADDTNAGPIFFAAYAYGMLNGYDKDSAIKIANTAAALSLTKVGINSIPDLKTVLETAKVNIPNNSVQTETTENNDSEKQEEPENHSEVVSEVVKENPADVQNQTESPTETPTNVETLELPNEKQ